MIHNNLRLLELMIPYGQLRNWSTAGAHFLEFNSTGVDGKRIIIYYVFETIYDEH